MNPLKLNIWSSQIDRDRKWYGGYKGLREGEKGKLLFNGYRVQICKIKSTGDLFCKSVHMHNTTERVRLKMVMTEILWFFFFNQN